MHHVTGGVSIGLVRSHTCLVAYASPKITFTTVQAREDAAAGTRRAVRLQLASRRTGRISFVRVCSASETEGGVRPLARREIAIGSSNFRVQSNRQRCRKAERVVRLRRVRCAVIRTAV
jgi:hypothetical protein